MADSRLKLRTSILINALGSNTCLAKVDLSGNGMEDIGAKMLSKDAATCCIRCAGRVQGVVSTEAAVLCSIPSHALRVNDSDLTDMSTCSDTLTVCKLIK